jgi:hypothetical protein
VTLIDECARRAHEELRAKLDAAALKALEAGHSWGEGPIVTRCPDAFRPFNLSEPMMHEIEVKAGPVGHDWVPPEGWRMIRHADWIAAGKPGSNLAQIPNPS